MAYDFPGKGKVAVLRTQPGTVLDDIGRLMELTGYTSVIDATRDTILNVNLASQSWIPARSTTPWQLEGVIRRLQRDGFTNLVAAQNRTGGIDPYIGERNNKHKYVVARYGVRNVHLYEPEVEWIVFEPQAEMLALYDLFPAGITVPKPLIGANVIHLPTVSASSVTTVAGAMWNAIGCLLPNRPDWTPAIANEALVDLLMIQHEINPGLLAVMDGTLIVGIPGETGTQIHQRDIILASTDMVAIDAVAARLQGLNPMDVPFIRLAHERGLGVGDPRGIELVGDDAVTAELAAVQAVTPDAIAEGDEPATTSLPAPLSAVVSGLYENLFWSPFVGRPLARNALLTSWGQLLQSYGDGKVVLPGPSPATLTIAGGIGGALFTALFLTGGRDASS